MGWSTHRTAELPAIPKPIGRHRRRRTGRIAMMAGVSVALLLVAGAVVAPQLHPPEGTPGAVSAPSTMTTKTTAATIAALRPTDTTPTHQPTPSPKATTTAKAAEPPSAYPLASFEDTVVVLVNAERAKVRGCPPLRGNRILHQVARAYSLDMARHRYLDHTGRDGSDPSDRMREAGYDTSRGWAENIARGYPTPARVMAGWMNSKGHRDNILNCDLRVIGVGAARAKNGEIFWTQDFGGR